MVVAIFYGVLMNILDLLTAREISIIGTGSRILIFGLGMSLILVTFHKYQVKNVARKYGVEDPDLKVRQNRSFRSKVGIMEIYELLKYRNGFSKICLDEYSGIISISTGFNGKSWGDKIIISQDKSSSEQHYQITSKPIFPFTVIDFGQNLENTLKVEYLIKNLA
jgi:hypothetical protein